MAASGPEISCGPHWIGETDGNNAIGWTAQICRTSPPQTSSERRASPHPPYLPPQTLPRPRGRVARTAPAGRAGWGPLVGALSVFSETYEGCTMSKTVTENRETMKLLVIEDE